MKRAGIKGIMGDFAAYAFSNIILKVISIIALPIITRSLSVSEYGAMDTITSSIALLPTIIGMGYDIAILKELIMIKETEKKCDTVATVLLFLVFWGGALIGLGVIFSRNISNWLTGEAGYSFSIIIALLNLYFNLFITLSIQLLRTQFRKREFVIMSVGQGISQLLMIILFVAGLSLGLKGYFIANLVSSIIWAVIGLLLNRKIIIGCFRKKILMKLLTFGIPVMFSSLAYWVFNLSDRIVLTRLTELSETGIYSMATKIVSIIVVIVAAFGQAWTPRAYELYEKDRASFPEHMEDMHPYIMTMFCFIALLNIAVGKLFVLLFSTKEYLNCLPILSSLSIASALQGMSRYVCMGIYFAERTTDIAKFTWISAVFNLIINLVFMSSFGAIIGGISTFIAYLFLYIAYYLRSIQYFGSSSHLFKPMVCLSFAIGLAYFISVINVENVFLDLLIKLFIAVLYIVILVILRILSIQYIKKLLFSFRRVST